MLLCIFAPGERQVGIYQVLRPLMLLSPQLRLVVQQDLALGHPADTVGIAIARSDQGCVNVGPAADAFATA